MRPHALNYRSERSDTDKQNAEMLVISALSKRGYMTAKEIWTLISQSAVDRDDRRFLKAGFLDQDQSVRKILAVLEKAKKVKSRQRASFALLEWTV